MKTTAKAHANIALVKYWGKRNPALNLPAVGSISMTLGALTTTTSLEFNDEFTVDRFILNSLPAGEKQTRRAGKFLDRFREMAGVQTFAEITSENNFPTGAGLASSASGFAALAVAADRALNLKLSPAALSRVARTGSGSAARSIFGGFVEMHRGDKPDGSDAVAEQLFDAQYWPLEMLILVTSEAEKSIGSTEGMNLTAKTSPYFPAWVESSVNDLAEMRDAIARRDFEKLGEIAEFSCFKMHGLAMSANPALIYWNDTTVHLIAEVRRLRKRGTPAYVTIDAGPQVKVICPPGESERLAAYFLDMAGVKQILQSKIGGDAAATSHC